MSLSDRILVMNNGQMVGELARDEADEQRLGLMMAGIGADDDVDRITDGSQIMTPLCLTALGGCWIDPADQCPCCAGRLRYRRRRHR